MNGKPCDIVSYALLTHMIAQASGLRAGAFVHSLGDARLHRNHRDRARTLLARKPHALPRLDLSVHDLSAFRYEDVAIEGYDPHPAIKAPAAV